MKRLLASLLMFATLTSPLFAAKKSTVSFGENVTVGSTQIRAGEYKLSYEGEGQTVKVTLARDGSSPIVLDAKLIPVAHGQASVTYATENGVRTLRQIDLSKASLIFEVPQAANQ
jgi:hypothetical protein